MIKLPSGYLDFNGDIEVEKQIKLFEELSTTDGDYSYSFTVERTANNIRLLENPFPDNITKRVYEKQDCEILSDEGEQIYFGALRVERVTDVFELSFFAGNNNWFGLLSSPISDAGFSDLDTDQTISNILVHMGFDEGIVFTLVDNGALVTRGYRQVKVEDYVAGIYVHTVFKRIFQHHSIKLEGDLFNEPLYWKLITQRNGKSQAELDASASYVEQSVTVARPGENIEYPVVFQNDSVYPYYDGENNPFDLATNSWTAPLRMLIDIEMSFTPQIVDASYNQRIYIYINGVFTFVDVGLDAGGLYNSATPGSQDSFTLKRSFVVEQGDVLTWTTEWQQSLGSTQNDVLRGWVKITPKYIYYVFGNSVVPNWSQQQYVSNIFKIFNVLPSYNAFTKTLTCNIFDKLRDKEPIDLSPYISATEVDYIEFISNYSKINKLSYKQVDFDNLKDYNIQNFFPYGTGAITADNDFLDDEDDMIESDFSNPQSYYNPVFDMSMERLNLITIQAEGTANLTAVNDASGVGRFVVDKDLFLPDDLVRIESNDPFYNKDWVVDTVTSETSPGAEDGYITLVGLPFDLNATGTVTKMVHKYNEVDDVYLLVNIPFYLVTNFSGFTTIFLESFARTEMSTAFFNLLQTGRQINSDYGQSLSFGVIENPFFYQRTLMQTYWGLTQRIFNDPVKLLSDVYLPHLVFKRIDFQRPVTYTTLETSNRYYVNRVTGYGHAQMELIKI